MFKVSTKAFFKIKAIFIIAVLLISISLAVLFWNHSLDPNDVIDPNLGAEKPPIPDYEDPLGEPNEAMAHEVRMEGWFTVFAVRPDRLEDGEDGERD